MLIICFLAFSEAKLTIVFHFTKLFHSFSPKWVSFFDFGAVFVGDNQKPMRNPTLIIPWTP